VLLFSPLFFGISIVYSSEGFAGGSSYTAILVLVGLSLIMVPSISLLLNIVVSSIAFISFTKAGYFDPRLVLPFLASIPFAFIGGMLVLPIMTLALIFADALFAASISLLSFRSKIKLQRAKIIRSDLSIKKLQLSVCLLEFPWELWHSWYRRRNLVIPVAYTYESGKSKASWGCSKPVHIVEFNQWFHSEFNQ
jgi:uncharacterized membrane protein YfcA